MHGRAKLLIGLDEAGYGPNIGPLVVVAVSLRVPARASAERLWQALAPEVSSYPPADGAELVVDDSKRVYAGGDGLETLERTALALMALSRGVPESLHELWTLYNLTPLEDFEQAPWYADKPLPIPQFLSEQQVQAAQRALVRSLKRAGCQWADVVCQIVQPPRFNAMLRRRGSKGSVLFDLASGLLRYLSQRSGAGWIEAVADKQGGRHYYGAMLQNAFPDTLVMAGREGPTFSHYVITAPRRSFHVRFVSGADAQHLLVAAASMIAKYIRELCMQRFNAYWSTRMPDLRPTAGYPVDARRFRRQVEPLARRSGIGHDLYWRDR